MRALAHPVRMSLLEMVRVAGTLARYGYIEEAGGGRGRERPWRIARDGMRLSRSSQSSPEAVTAADALEAAWMQRWLERIRNAFAGHAWPAEWEGAAQASQSMRFLTAEEMGRMRNEIQEVVDRYRDRPGDPADEPAGALPVEVGVFVYPRAELAGLVDDGGAQPQQQS